MFSGLPLLTPPPTPPPRHLRPSSLLSWATHLFIPSRTRLIHLYSSSLFSPFLPSSSYMLFTSPSAFLLSSFTCPPLILQPYTSLSSLPPNNTATSPSLTPLPSTYLLLNTIYRSCRLLLLLTILSLPSSFSPLSSSFRLTSSSSSVLHPTTPRGGRVGRVASVPYLSIFVL